MAASQDVFAPRPKKASRACHLCSTTKVRCTAEAGSPCQNCTRRGMKCVTDQRIRRKRRMHPKLSGLVPRPQDPTWSTGAVPSPDNTYPSMIASPQSVPTSEELVSPVTNTSSDWTQSTMSPSPTSIQGCAINHLTPPKTPEEDFWNAFTHLSSGQESPCNGMSPTPMWPNFIQPLPTTMDAASIEYLLSNAVFSLPETSLQNALLQAFLECVLPSMPIIEWQQFLNAINDQESGYGSISLLLFHAVMFSATPFVGLGHLLQAGYLSRREAHEAFFQKVKLLYDSNYETDPITIVQSLLLMTYRVDSADGGDSRHWIKAAISTASSIGLLSDFPMTLGFQCSPLLWKRIAWACYTMDSLIALRLRCRPIMQYTLFTHQMLTEDDFELGVLSSENGVVPVSCGVVRNIKTQRELADLCIANARLCLSINEILKFRAKNPSSTGSHSGSGPRSGSPSTPDSNFNDIPDQTTMVSTCEMDLSAWANSLPVSCQAPSLELYDMDEDPAVVVQRSLLHMVFFTAVAILHQSQPYASSKLCVKHAAQQITLIVSELHKRNFQDRMSVVGVTATLVALLIHMAELKTTTAETQEALKNTRSCLDVMATLRDVYWEADNVTAMAVNTMGKAGFTGVGV